MNVQANHGWLLANDRANQWSKTPTKLPHDVGPMEERTKASRPETFNSSTKTFIQQAQQGLFNQQWQVSTIAIMNIYLQWMDINHNEKAQENSSYS